MDSIPHATSLKLPLELKARIDRMALEAGVSAHAFMVNALDEATRSASQREAFETDALDALAEMQRSGKGYALADVRAYFEQRAAHRGGQSAKPPRPRMTKF